MAILAASELEILTKEQSKWCSSIYMPTHRKGVDTQQDPIRLKELLKQAQARLVSQGVRAPEAEESLKAGYGLLDQRDFWQNQSDGLAVFISSHVFRYYRLPQRFDELVMVNNRFYIKPLLPVLRGDGRFFVLALSQAQVRLLQGTRYSVEEMYLDGIPNLPKSLAETLKYDVYDNARQLHTFTGEPGTKGGRTAIFHGQGSNELDPKTNIRRFFHQVNDGLHVILANEQAPMVLAGVEYLHPIYREVSTYPRLMDEGILGNPDDLKAGDLHARAWKIVAPLFETPEKQAVEAYKQLAGEKKERVSDDLRTILPAAFYGRVGTLIMARDAQVWGKFDPQTENLQVHTQRESGDEDLYDLAAVQTILNSGDVYVFDSTQMPVRSHAAAVFRY